MNQAILIGNLTDDPKMKTTNSGKRVVNFSVATNETYVKNGEKMTSAQYHRCVAWDYLADTAGELVKGDPVVVVGKITTRSYDYNGEKRYVTEIVCNSVSTFNKAKKADFSRFGKRTNEEIPF